MADADDLPFMAEYAKSGRSSCKGCKNSIEKESLRLAVMIKSPRYDGKKTRVKSESEIKQFGELRWEDQQKIKEKLVPHGSGGISAKVEKGSDLLKDFLIDRAKSSRSICRGCEQKIAKDFLRVSRKDHESENAKRFGAVDRWHHLNCFAKKRDEFEFYSSGSLIPGFDDLGEDDKQLVKQELPEIKSPGSSKRSVEESSAPAKKVKKEQNNNEEDKILKKQNERIYGYRDKLQKELSKAQWQELLEINNQENLSGESKILNHLSDCMTFGALLPCPECKGQIVLGTGEYCCKGNMTEWTKCTFTTKKPKRTSFDIPEDLKNDHLFLKKYKYVSGDRVFSSAELASCSLVVPEKSKESSKSGEALSKSSPVIKKITVKGVDPDSGLETKAHVYEEKSKSYMAVLNLVDVIRGTNSYYKLQLLEANDKKKYWIFRAWGRIGTDQGGSKVEKLTCKDDAKDLFKSLYEEKTGNPWGIGNKFVKHPNKFFPMDLDEGEEAMKSLKDIKSNVPSKLEESVQNLIFTIFDIEIMKKTMIEFEIDMNKMPLGKISRRQIENAYTILTELQKIIDESQTSVKALDASNRFYTLIPHDFGLKRPPILDNTEIIKTKMEMLESLLEIEVAYNIIKGVGNNEDQNPIDSYYISLKTDIKVLDKTTDEFDILKRYVKNTHAATHNQYSLSIKEIFKINRNGEEKRFKPFKKLHNRMLLWHGSRMSNFVGILSRGLQIAPPEAPVTGYMFGKGIYFADMVSKSANYCFANKENPAGLLLLCEVALGNMHELKNADFITKLPPGKHSTKGVGSTCPDPKVFHTTSDGVVIPYGKSSSTKVVQTSLLYNEYIVYDIAQVNVKYVVELDFKWKF